jgi:hypothetical protein
MLTEPDTCFIIHSSIPTHPPLEFSLLYAPVLKVLPHPYLGLIVAFSLSFFLLGFFLTPSLIIVFSAYMTPSLTSPSY